MVHVGIDLHQKTGFLHALDDQTGEICLDQAVPSERQALLDCLTPLRERGELRLILEACGFAGITLPAGGTRWDTLQPYGEVVAVHPKQVKGYRGEKRKNDRRDAEFLAAARPDRRVELLDTLPGLDYFGALLVAVELGDWRRFHSGEAVACFAGLVPSERASGGRIERGPITKEGSPYLRWIMVQAA